MIAEALYKHQGAIPKATLLEADVRQTLQLILTSKKMIDDEKQWWQLMRIMRTLQDYETKATNSTEEKQDQADMINSSVFSSGRILQAVEDLDSRCHLKPTDPCDDVPLEILIARATDLD